MPLIKQESKRNFLEDIIENPKKLKEIKFDSLSYLGVFSEYSPAFGPKYIFSRPMIFGLVTNDIFTSTNKTLYILIPSKKIYIAYPKFKHPYVHESEITEIRSSILFEEDAVFPIRKEDKERFEELFLEEEKEPWYKKLINKNGKPK